MSQGRRNADPDHCGNDHRREAASAGTTSPMQKAPRGGNGRRVVDVAVDVYAKKKPEWSARFREWLPILMCNLKREIPLVVYSHNTTQHDTRH